MTHREVSYSDLPSINPDFSIVQNDYSNPSPVTFINESTGSLGWFLWDFGDGNISIEKNPVHEYTSDGPHTVTLTILDYNGSPISKTINDLVSFNNEIIPGDLNLDSSINVLDVVMMINLVLDNINDYSGILHEIGDLDESNSVDILDIVLLVNLILEN